MVQASTIVSDSSPDVILRTVGLTKRFGSFTAVDGLDLEVRRGEVLGFLGPNGAGKSTTVGMILGLIKPSAGRIEYNGLSLQQIGAIIEAPAFYPYLSGRDNLQALALAAGGVRSGRIDELLEYVGLGDRPKSPYRTYSLGMKQRLGIASTLLLDPALVILDEPTNGLDPAGQREIRGLIPQLAREGRSVLLASHLLHEVEQVCDRVAIVRHGKLIQSGTVRDIVGQGSFLEIKVAEPERAAQILSALPFVERVELRDGGALAIYTLEEHGPDVTRALSSANLYVSSMTRRRHSLEEVFLELTEEESASTAEVA
ncbi:MAG TPA: ABC transporter ATP-binding protein [Dehalococcoidia bacterium]|nr:ABC transporter ATP-binding protein [Dehalococcoidia bacterium]